MAFNTILICLLVVLLIKFLNQDFRGKIDYDTENLMPKQSEKISIFPRVYINKRFACLSLCGNGVLKS